MALDALRISRVGSNCTKPRPRGTRLCWWTDATWEPTPKGRRRVGRASDLGTSPTTLSVRRLGRLFGGIAEAAGHVVGPAAAAEVDPLETFTVGSAYCIDTTVQLGVQGPNCKGDGRNDPRCCRCVGAGDGEHTCRRPTRCGSSH